MILVDRFNFKTYRRNALNVFSFDNNLIWILTADTDGQRHFLSLKGSDSSETHRSRTRQPADRWENVSVSNVLQQQ